MTRKEAAEYLRMSERKLRYLEEKGRGRPVRDGRWIRYKVSALDAFIQRLG